MKPNTATSSRRLATAGSSNLKVNIEQVRTICALKKGKGCNKNNVQYARVAHWLPHTYLGEARHVGPLAEYTSRSRHGVMTRV